ncbi:nuclear transport factor 2 family protein [Pseudonocardia pini]|uniref:nuclear transport factor 2 family protein n=1 Tax=Pseudonocardia pini TaxID=2758030 RepID=UPI0015F0C370|nr:nuclear transport factor 2 family protein [Pseudonocardia pini]
MTTTETWAEGYLSAWDSGDPDRIMAWMADDAVFTDVPSGHTAEGAAAVREFVESALRKAPGATFEVQSSVVTDEAFAIEWIMQPAALRGASVGRRRDGRITVNRDYWNAG